jgi:hypothetical protein
MKNLLIILCVLLLGNIASPLTRGQTAADCANLMKFGIYDQYHSMEDKLQFQQIQQFFNSYQFESKQAAENKAGELGLNIVEVLKLDIGGSSSSSNFSQWQQNIIKASYEEVINKSTEVKTIQTISSKITELVGACLAQQGLHVYLTPVDTKSFSVLTKFVPISSIHPKTKGTVTITPASVALNCTPSTNLGTSIDIGPEAVGVLCRRAPGDTVQVMVQTEDGTGTVSLAAYNPPKASIIRFTASSAKIKRGESLRLEWSVENSSSVKLGTGNVEEQGSRTVAPTENTTYTLIAFNVTGGSIERTINVEVTQPPPYLTGTRVFFHTTDDDKDGDTSVTVNVVCAGATVASVSGGWGPFGDGGDNGPFGMNVLVKQPNNEINGVCRAQLIESPNGHDEWHFSWWVELTFSDGTVMRRDGGGNVDYDRPNASIAF